MYQQKRHHAQGTSVVQTKRSLSSRNVLRAGGTFFMPTERSLCSGTQRNSVEQRRDSAGCRRRESFRNTSVPLAEHPQNNTQGTFKEQSRNTLPQHPQNTPGTQRDVQEHIRNTRGHSLYHRTLPEHLRNTRGTVAERSKECSRNVLVASKDAPRPSGTISNTPGTLKNTLGPQGTL